MDILMPPKICSMPAKLVTDTMTMRIRHGETCSEENLQLTIGKLMPRSLWPENVSKFLVVDLNTG